MLRPATDDIHTMSNQVPRQFMTFALIGVGGLLVDMASLFIAQHLLMLDLYSGRVFSYLMAATFTWYMNRRFTFVGVSRRAALKQWARFIAANAIGAVVNYSVYVLVLRIGPSVIDMIGLWPQVLGALLPYAGVAAGSVSGLVFNFVLSKKLVFRQA